jgi:hypothetical protein
MTVRPTFTIQLRAEPGVADPMLALRRALKALLRAYGLRCTALRREPPLLEQPGQGGVAAELVHTE